MRLLVRYHDEILVIEHKKRNRAYLFSGERSRKTGTTEKVGAQRGGFPCGRDDSNSLNIKPIK